MMPTYAEEEAGNKPMNALNHRRLKIPISYEGRL
jgi:hypothetical protein